MPATLTAHFPGNKAASLAASELFDSGFSPEEIQAIFPLPEPLARNKKLVPQTTLILRLTTRSAEARTILLQHGADLV